MQSARLHDIVLVTLYSMVKGIDLLAEKLKFYLDSLVMRHVDLIKGG